ncbi:hypothetical protein PAXRUDRAFT_658549 [Paxillus rubicundulus Ve08.2h10]|uniref:Uncharacterized protein n=1 Tax=Paxillus rubicundulus Ve08.2h10 TaxID=930991 RepID=A0A0D0E299_9AGAM|nr:hypothetical protein PAXRUDRAFT_658549 [Paxillus rubicundulus Ve08.2h10]
MTVHVAISWRERDVQCKCAPMNPRYTWIWNPTRDNFLSVSQVQPSLIFSDSRNHSSVIRNLCPQAKNGKLPMHGSGARTQTVLYWGNWDGLLERCSFVATGTVLQEGDVTSIICQVMWCGVSRMERLRDDVEMFVRGVELNEDACHKPNTGIS